MEKDDCRVKILYTYNTYVENIFSFTNNIKTVEGGTP